MKILCRVVSLAAFLCTLAVSAHAAGFTATELAKKCQWIESIERDPKALGWPGTVELHECLFYVRGVLETYNDPVTAALLTAPAGKTTTCHDFTIGQAVHMFLKDQDKLKTIRDLPADAAILLSIHKVSACKK